MVNGCVKGLDDCGCECHRIPGVKHVMPCCDKPALGSRLEKPDGTEWIWVMAIRQSKDGDTNLKLEKSTDYDKDRDPGDETDE